MRGLNNPGIPQFYIRSYNNCGVFIYTLYYMTTCMCWRRVEDIKV